MRLAERRRDIGDVADAESDRIGVEEAIGEGQRLGVGLGPDEAVDAAFLRALHAHFEHRRIDVRHRHARAVALEAEGDVAGAAGHVEDLLARARLHATDEAVLP